jgi:hypothetical protein
MPEYIVFQRLATMVDPNMPGPQQAQAVIVTADSESEAMQQALDSRMLQPSPTITNPIEVADIEAHGATYEIEPSHTVKGKLKDWKQPVMEIPPPPEVNGGV